MEYLAEELGGNDGLRVIQATRDAAGDFGDVRARIEAIDQDCRGVGSARAVQGRGHRAGACYDVPEEVVAPVDVELVIHGHGSQVGTRRRGSRARDGDYRGDG